MSRVRRALADLLNWLNGIGSVVLAYAMLNPTAASDFLNVLPDKLKTPVALMLPAIWFVVVQYAKARAVAKGASNAS